MMLVRELIEELLKEDQELDVWIADEFASYSSPVDADDFNVYDDKLWLN